jgi:hypothetical protein
LWVVGQALDLQKGGSIQMQWKRAAAAVTVAAAAAIGVGTMAGASASVPARHGPSGAVIRVINLHKAYQRALPLAHHGRVMGKLQPRGKRLNVKGATGPASCVEPNCNLTYHNGLVQHHPHVYLLLWGPAWNPSGPDVGYLASFYGGLGVGPQDTWSAITSQYSDGSGHPTFSGSVLQGAFLDTSAPPADVSQTNLNAEADAFVTSMGITDRNNAQIVIASQTGTCFNDGFVGNPSGCSSSPPTYCAWHTNSTLGETFTNLPYLLDAGLSCGQNFINSGSAGTYDGFSIVGGHEYAETITDPAPVSGWFDAADNVSGGENGDKCAWAGELWGTPDPAGNVTLSTGSFAMQSTWSNAASGCVMSATPPPPSGPITGYRGKCVDDAASRTTNGNKIDLWTCNRTGAQNWTVRTNNTLTVFGKCMDIQGASSLNGAKIQLWSCNGGWNQVWVHQSNGELVNPHSGKCLTDPGYSTVNGTQLVLWSCAATADQIWHLP